MTTSGDQEIFKQDDNVKDGEYHIVTMLGHGNSGQVYRLTHPRHGENRVVKFFIPFYQLRQIDLPEGDTQEEIEVDMNRKEEIHKQRSRQVLEENKSKHYQSREYKFLSRIDHPFVTKVHDSGSQPLTSAQKERYERTAPGASELTKLELPLIIAAYVEGEALDKGLLKVGRDGVIKVLRSIAEALDYIHSEHHILHLDIKSSNIRVRPDGYPILLDFALSQDLSSDALTSSTDIRGEIDWDLTPFRTGTSSVAEFFRNVQQKGISRKEFRDETFPGLDIYQVGILLKHNAQAICDVLTPAERNYFDLLVEHLISWDEVRNIEPGGLSDIIRRIDATQFYLAIRPGSMSGGKEVSLSSGRKVFVPPKFVPIVDHPELTRLNRLNQLSLLPSEFSGATHSRYEHSLDAFGLAQSAARRLLDDPQCRRIFSEKDVEVLVTASLLHDINHLPLTHLYQECGVPLLGTRDLFQESLDYSYVNHQSLGEVASVALQQDQTRFHRLIEAPWEAQEEEADQIISSLINSGVDLDKLSYLKLDSERSGLGFAAGIDVSALLQAMQVVQWKKYDQDGTFVFEGYHVAFRDSALPLIEALVMARVRAFRDLYWCNENRAMMAQFINCVRQIALTEGGIDALNRSIVDVRGETDFAVLRRLDELASELLEVPHNLSALYDSISAQRPVLIYSSSTHWDAIHKLSLDNRLNFESHLSSAIAESIADSLNQPFNLIVDVPERSIGLGGDILVVDRHGDVRTGMSASDTIRLQHSELRSLSTRVRIFVSAPGANEWVESLGFSQREGLESSVGSAISTALGRSSLR